MKYMLSMVLILAFMSIDVKAQWEVKNGTSFIVNSHINRENDFGFNLETTGGNYGYFIENNNTGTNQQTFYFGQSNGSKNIFGISSSSDTGGSWESRLVINQNGFIGIGTNSPEYILDVKKGIRIRKSTFGVTMASSDNGWLRDEWLTGNYGPVQWNQNTQKWSRPSGDYNDIGGVLWQDEGTYFIRDHGGDNLEYSNKELLEQAFLFADIVNGNIGIGTADPGSWKLAVNGKIRAKEIKVETGWSDFVFEENYNLPTLEEVEKHIQEKGHLKDIPSAKEVAKEGIYLGEMDAKLLQKIEELTLYAIDQEKRMDNYENVIEYLTEVIKNQQESIEKLQEAHD
ncbi:hypothetical protein [Galbibacter pacificus]|uniref:Peptidase S74 domain-containing protein n=1 Tax=Galbibacter pacificus TaxID=2996052 RepID=A0ABT6FNA1_9FLAO|nr:hypothetical protein [Galbibacter pacificus]MDG3581260.1 hypothetical protein [Galbibacter pacificus]MDG3584738.1 hypothetical protein [Galbibacter pacificus]